MANEAPMTLATALARDRFAWCGESIAYWAARTPDAVAISDTTATLTYRALEHMIEETATALSAGGLRAGDRLVILCENAIGAVLAIFAAQRLRAWAVPLNALK